EVQMTLEEHALTQAGLGRLEAVEAARLDDRLDDGRAGEDEIAAGRLDAGDAAALARGHGGELADEVVERVAGDDEALDADRGQPGGRRGRGGEVADGAADAHEAVAGAPQTRRGPEPRDHMRAQRL